MEKIDNNETFGRLNVGNRLYTTRISRKYASRKPYTPADPALILSFIPGTVTEIYIEAGQQVRKGDTLMILDAMKMKNKLKSKADGTVRSVMVKKGDRVSKGTVLVELEK